jgi:hypothetical protein
MTDIYQILDDGRVIELQMGRRLDCEQAIWARDLTPQERRTYFRLKSLGYSDWTIYNQINSGVKAEACAGS